MANNFSPQIIHCNVVHARHVPVPHNFNYSFYWHAFDLSDLSNLQRQSKLFGYNSYRPFSLFDKDYLDGKEAPLREKVIAAIRKFGHYEELGSIIVVTAPRYFGYVFNPVSYFFCYSQQKQFLYLVVEINNTYSERSLYVVPAYTSSTSKADDEYRVQQDKNFYVSPFFELDYQYDFQFHDIRNKLDIRINLVKDGKVVFNSRVWEGMRVTQLTTRTHAALILRYPITPLLTMPRILYQALQLNYLRKLPVIAKPNPTHTSVVFTKPYSWLDMACIAFMKRFVRNLRAGKLTVTYPDRHVEVYGTSRIEGNDASITLNNYNIFRKIVFSGSIGLGESYMEGDWDTDNLSALLKLFFNNADVLDERKLNIFKPARLLHRIGHWFKKNTIAGSQKNIGAHYDISNDLFKAFLDPSMMYSCAYYSSQDDDLEKAQQNKIQKIIEKAQLDSRDTVLEIGSGWGSFALTAAKKCGCAVTSITVSKEQLALASQRNAESSVSNLVDFKFQDYRTVQGSFDKLVSIEMLEAVGHENLGSFFKMCERVLKPCGVAVLQFIAIPDQYYSSYLRRTDFIQKHVFPGSHLPSLNALLKAVQNNSSLVVDSIENIGPHYARTLAEWRKRFNDAKSKVLSLGYNERFCRLWNFYLSSCEAEFATRWLNVFQVVLTRPNNTALISQDSQKIYSA